MKNLSVGMGLLRWRGGSDAPTSVVPGRHLSQDPAKERACIRRSVLVAEELHGEPIKGSCGDTKREVTSEEVSHLLGGNDQLEQGWICI